MRWRSCIVCSHVRAAVCSVACRVFVVCATHLVIWCCGVCVCVCVYRPHPCCDAPVANILLSLYLHCGGVTEGGRVHIDVFPAMTGITRFGERDDPIWKYVVVDTESACGCRWCRACGWVVYVSRACAMYDSRSLGTLFVCLLLTATQKRKA